MTIEQLLECSADQLEKMSDADLLKHFEPYRKITRPEFAEKPVVNSKRVTNGPVKLFDAKKAKANAILAQLGIDLKI